MYVIQRVMVTIKSEKVKNFSDFFNNFYKPSSDNALCLLVEMFLDGSPVESGDAGDLIVGVCFAVNPF